jgi:predicted nucleic acid-binding Zn ribbon protein
VGGKLHKERKMETYSEEEAFEMVLCPSCGSGNEKESCFCKDCGKVLREERKKRFKKRSLLLGGIALVLILAIGFFATRISQSQAIGKVNGEAIGRQEFSKRVERMKRFYENRYGEDLFRGDEGTQQLNRLRAQILDEMVTEKILLQEARTAGYASVPPGEVEKRLEEIKMKGLCVTSF